jgi:hypothetical protein
VYSKDGIEWSNFNTNLGFYAGASNGNSVKYGNGLWLISKISTFKLLILFLLFTP